MWVCGWVNWWGVRVRRWLVGWCVGGWFGWLIGGRVVSWTGVCGEGLVCERGGRWVERAVG